MTIAPVPANTSENVPSDSARSLCLIRGFYYGLEMMTAGRYSRYRRAVAAYPN